MRACLSEFAPDPWRVSGAAGRGRVVVAWRGEAALSLSVPARMKKKLYDDSTETGRPRENYNTLKPRPARSIQPKPPPRSSSCQSQPRTAPAAPQTS